MAQAVVFDFYGTLAHWADPTSWKYSAVFADFGYELPDEVIEAYFSRYDGIDHSEHSVSEEAYEAWARHRLLDLTDACEVAPEQCQHIIDALRESDRGPMVVYPEARPTLLALRDQGWVIGVCSNWGWDLDSFLQQVGVDDLVDVAITSAQAGARKPHPSIYDHCAHALGIDAAEIVFVGDSWSPDVEGPHSAGMTPVHVWRIDERGSEDPVELSEGMHRIGDLSELVTLLEAALSR
jgi:putative hydrolase of the HAD superfamily